MLDLKDLLEKGDKLYNFEFEWVYLYTVSEYYEIYETIFSLQELQEDLHPDSDDFETIELMVEDKLQPMLNHLDYMDSEFFSCDYIKAQLKEREKGLFQWKKMIT